MYAHLIGFMDECLVLLPVSAGLSTRFHNATTKAQSS